jgi:hypothetical protein
MDVCKYYRKLLNYILIHGDQLQLTQSVLVANIGFYKLHFVLF